jgi:hypothetical protein
MELDDLKSKWEACDRKLDANIRLTTRLLNLPVLRKAETALTRLRRAWQVELVLAGIATAWLGWFNWYHIAEPRFLIPGLMLHAGAVVLLSVYVRQIIAISAIDFAAPIVGIQKQLELIRIREIHATKWTLLLSPLAWTPSLIVAFEGFLGIDAYAVFNTKWLLANVVFGIVIVAVERWVAHRYAERMGRSPRLQRWMRDLTGYNLGAAMKFLHVAKEFEEERAV